jgi:hypothetical protein
VAVDDDVNEEGMHEHEDEECNPKAGWMLWRRVTESTDTIIVATQADWPPHAG